MIQLYFYISVYPIYMIRGFPFVQALGMKQLRRVAWSEYKVYWFVNGIIDELILHICEGQWKLTTILFMIFMLPTIYIQLAVAFMAYADDEEETTIIELYCQLGTVKHTKGNAYSQVSLIKYPFLQPFLIFSFL